MFRKKQPYKKIISVDFDGVIHGYTSGWQGMDVVEDAPVPGAMAWLYDIHERFDIQIYSSRSKSVLGRRAMQKWLKHHLERELGAHWYKVYRHIKWPWFKPAAFLTIDDRAMRFTGQFPEVRDINGFKTWQQGK